MTDSDELTQARREIRALRIQLADAKRAAEKSWLRYEAERDQVERLAGQIDALRRTKSWRVTVPLRVVRRLMGRPNQ